MEARDLQSLANGDMSNVGYSERYDEVSVSNIPLDHVSHSKLQLVQESSDDDDESFRSVDHIEVLGSGLEGEGPQDLKDLQLPPF